LIGTLRRECLDHVLIFHERHLRRVLTSYSLHYNETFTHLGLGKDEPLRQAVQRSGTIVATPILSGLHHRYARKWFSRRTVLHHQYDTDVEVSLWVAHRSKCITEPLAGRLVPGRTAFSRRSNSLRSRSKKTDLRIAQRSTTMTRP